MEDGVKQAAKTVWDYMQVRDSVTNAECMVVLGSRDDRVAEYAAKLLNEHEFRVVIISGGNAHHNDLLATNWEASDEATHFASVMSAKGIRQTLLLEKRALNTGQNALYSYELLKMQGILPHTILIVTKPYMERRAKATFEAQWRGKNTHFIVTSPDISFDDYFNDEQPYETVLSIMVGDLQRILEYPKHGFQTSQQVPEEILEAFEFLKNAGYAKHLPTY